MIFLITGTSRGIGMELATYYLAEGNTVIGCSTGEATFQHPDYIHRTLDLSNESEIFDLIKYLRKQFGRVDVLINNAAVNPAISLAALLSSEAITRTFSINVIAPMILCRECIKLMARKNFGRIINIGSMATRHEVSGESLYTATKAALMAYTRVISKETHALGITANMLAPSVIATDLSGQINQDALQEVLQRNAIKGYGDFGDVINSINFLLKPESSAITGQIIYLGGV